jgi:hypothetical protein
MTNRLQIGIPQALRLVISVANIIAYLRGFPTEFTYPAHNKTSFLSRSIVEYGQRFIAVKNIPSGGVLPGKGAFVTQ